MNTTPDVPIDDSTDEASNRRRWWKWGAIGLVAIVVVGFGLILLYAKVLNDSPAALGETDLDAALSVDGTADTTTETVIDTTADTSVDTTADTGADPAASTLPTPTEPNASTPAASEPSATEPSAADPSASGATSMWTVAQPSEVRYRVKEILFGVSTEGVGGTEQVTGDLTIDGTAVTESSFSVDIASFESNEGRRDSQFRGRIMSADQFPTADFVLTAPIDLGTEAVDGAEVVTMATGDLTLRGVTNSVTFEVTAKLENGKIGVLGNIPIVFADYEIANPSIGGITTEDDGVIEFVLVFEPIT